MISLQEKGGGGGVNMRTESRRLLGGHHMWRHKGIFLFYKELKEQISFVLFFLNTDLFSETGSHGLMLENLFKDEDIFFLSCLLWFPLVVSSRTEVLCSWVMGSLRLRPSVFVCPVGSFVAEAVPSPGVPLLLCTHLQIHPLRH